VKILRRLRLIDPIFLPSHRFSREQLTRRVLQRVLMLAAIAGLGGCSSLVAVVEYPTEIVATQSTQPSPSVDGALTIVARKAVDEHAFEAARDGKKVLWAIAANGSFDGEIGNYSPQPFCLHLSESTLSSNFQAVATALPVTVQRVTSAGKTTIRPEVSYGRVISLSTLCIAPGERTRYILQMHRTVPSPSGFLFNAPGDADTPTLVDSVKGNWVRVIVPYSLGDQKDTLVATFTATGARAVRVAW
jgi:hypothetical protein